MRRVAEFANFGKDGAFVRKPGETTSRTLQAGKGHYKSLAFDDKTQQLAFLSDQAEYEKPVSPYRLYYWKVGDPNSAIELVSAATRGMPQGMVVADSAPRFSEDGARLILGTAPWWLPRVGLYPYLGVEIAVWMVYAMGYNLLLGHSGLPSFGHGAFFAHRLHAIGRR